MLKAIQLKIQTRKPAPGQGGRAKGGTAKNLLNYQKDLAAAQYYADGGCESTSLGDGWKDLGIDQATDDQLLNLLNGFGPDGIELANRTVNKDGEVRVGYDLTLSPPKDFSIIAEFGDKNTQERMREVERKAVKAVVDYVQASGLVKTRSGTNGKNVEHATKLLFQANYHNTNRSNDPTRHIHLVMMGMAKDSGGKWRKIEAKGIYSREKELGAVFRSEIARGLVEAGFAVERDEQAFRVVGMPEDIKEHFSKGKAKVMAAMGDSFYAANSKTKSAVNLKVRSEKEHKSREDLESSWDEQLERFGLTREYLLDSVASIGRNSEQKFAEYSEKAVLEALNKKSQFSDLDLRREVAQCMAAGAGGVEEIKAAIASIQNSRDLVKLRTEDGKELFTTRQNRESEIEALKIVAYRQGKGRPVSEEAFEKGLAEAERIKGFRYTPQQRQAVRTLTQGCSKDRQLQGVAGAGKTTLALAVRLAYQAEGRRVYGAALSGKAARGLGDGTGIESQTIDYWLTSGKIKDWPPGSVLLIDEASMIDTQKFRQLIEVAEKNSIEIGWIGDSKQLQSIGAGSIFAHLFERARPEDKFEITEATRQKGEHAKDWKAALGQMRDGDSRPAFDYLEKLGGLSISEGDGVQEAMEKWRKNRESGIEDKENIIVTNTNAMKQRLNDAARIINGQAQRADNISVEVTNRDGEAVGSKQFAPGDRIMTMKNAKLAGLNLKGIEDHRARKRADQVQNGSLWTIDLIKKARLGGQIIQMTNDKGASIRFNTKEYSNIDHAYALTVHQAQGVSAQAVTGLASSAAMIDKHSTYVTLSRSELAERTAFVVPQSMIEEREIIDETEQTESQSIADQMQSFITATERERIDYLSINHAADNEQRAELEALDMQIINTAFPAPQQAEAEVEVEPEVQVPVEHKRTLADFEAEQEDLDAAHNEYIQMIAAQEQEQQQSQGRVR